MVENDPIRQTDDDARLLARKLIDAARFGAIGVRDPASGAPQVSRIAVAPALSGEPISLISDLSAHTVALRKDPTCSLLLGEPGSKGDPLTHPRITLTARGSFVGRTDAGFVALRSHWLSLHPKAKLYIDFGDFNFFVFRTLSAALNGGFGKAYHLTPEDLGLPCD